MSHLEHLWQEQSSELSTLSPVVRQQIVDEFATDYLSMRWVNRMWQTLALGSADNRNHEVSPQVRHRYLLIMELLASVVTKTPVVTLTADRYEAIGKIYTPPTTTTYGKVALLLHFHRSGLSVDSINHICHYQGHPVKVEWISYLFATLQSGRLKDFDAHLAEAFVEQTLVRAQAEKHPPLIGDFIMSPPRFPALAHLNLNHIRLHINGHGIWFGLVGQNGGVWVGYWSVADTLMWTLPPADAWPLRVFFACLWLDLKSVKHQTVRIVVERESQAFGLPKRKEKYIVLPRRINTLEWAGEKAMFGDGGKDSVARNVRAHYRRLPEGWSAGKDAVELAQRYGFPVPPSGYTFVQAYHTGDLPPSEADTRLISTGLDVAWVALGY
jgi:hypothetical protein